MFYWEGGMDGYRVPSVSLMQNNKQYMFSCMTWQFDMHFFI
uniref:Uncharacterized protein n=1 Tax=Arundo donax TaxID=35708 RepID=A0A0A9GN57_ARUDO